MVKISKFLVKISIVLVKLQKILVKIKGLGQISLGFSLNFSKIFVKFIEDFSRTSLIACSKSPGLQSKSGQISRRFWSKSQRNHKNLGNFRDYDQNSRDFNQFFFEIFQNVGDYDKKLKILSKIFNILTINLWYFHTRCLRFYLRFREKTSRNFTRFRSES